MNLPLFRFGSGLVGKLCKQKLIWPLPSQMVSRDHKGGRGTPRKEASIYASSLGGVTTQSTNVCRLSLGHAETGPAEVLPQ